jgi:tRNA U34 5-methylaminomethyl-2-thiouridine-forming methyltransferase MnmC
MRDALQLLITNDGSHTLLNAELNETYHSLHGALQESQHVFIRHGLQYVHEAFGLSEIFVLEVGFGTGLNAWLTLQYASQNKIKVSYTTLEAFPLPASVWQQLNYAPAEDESFKKIHQCDWNRCVEIADTFTIQKLQTLYADAPVPSNAFHLCYYDAFAPSKQPAMWSMESLKKASDALAAGGTFVTYCAKGQVKRDLRSLGLQVQTLSGPPGKKEMIRAIRT